MLKYLIVACSSCNAYLEVGSPESIGFIQNMVENMKINEEINWKYDHYRDRYAKKTPYHSHRAIRAIDKAKFAE